LTTEATACLSVEDLKSKAGAVIKSTISNTKGTSSAGNADGVTKNMLTEQWPIDRPKPYPKNARKWGAAAVDKVAASIHAYGFRQPIVVDLHDVIIIGHLRLTAAKKLGLKEVPVHVAFDLTPAQVRGLRLADNRTNQEASFDEELLAIEMAELILVNLQSRPLFELVRFRKMVVQVWRDNQDAILRVQQPPQQYYAIPRELVQIQALAARATRDGRIACELVFRRSELLHGAVEHPEQLRPLMNVLAAIVSRRPLGLPDR
jgi:hypothetical protein